MSDNPRELYTRMSTDDLVATILELKEQINSIKLPLDYCEAELRDRLVRNNAKHLMGEAYRVKTVLKRDIVWDQDALRLALEVAEGEGRCPSFHKAFPQKFDCSVVNLNALLKLGGKTVEAIEAAKVETKEKVYLSYDRLSNVT